MPTRRLARTTAIAPLAALALLAAALLLLAPAPPHAAAGNDGPQLNIQQVDADSYPDVTAVLTVLDEHGVPVPGLSAADFAAFENEAGVDVTAATAVHDEDLRLAVVIAIDVSGSMGLPLEDTGEIPMAAVRAAAIDFVRALEPDDEAAVVAFATDVTLVQDFTSDRVELASALAGLEAEGFTALYEAVDDVVALLDGHDATRKAVVMLGDGENNQDRDPLIGRDDSLALAADAGIPFFTLLFGGTGPDPDFEYLRQLAAGTRGAFFDTGAADVDEVYAEIAGLLRSQYVVALRAPGAADGADATLRVAADVDGVAAEGSATFRRGEAGVLPPVVDEEGGASVLQVVLVAGFAVAVLALLALLGWRRIRERRDERARARISGRQSAEGLPAPAPAAPQAAHDDGRGRVVALTGDAAGTGYHFGSLPLVIGSDPKCGAPVPAGPDVAPEHAHIWTRNGKIMLRHVGGPRRHTTVAGRDVDWVILEHGDEFRVGPHTFRAERAE